MYTERVKKLNELETLLDKDVYVLCHNRRNDAYIDGTMIDVLRRMMRFTKRRNGAALIIQTPGGDLNESYYIGEFFREYYDYTESYVVSDCYSGGTIIALSTDNIYLSRSGCLGPIDIQRYNFPSEDNNWYPSLTGNVGALMKAEHDGKVTDFQQKSFRNDMDVLATYYKEDYTYQALVGDNVKKHCVDKENWEKVWEYLAAINISHGSPLTYKKLIDLGLMVNLMDSYVEKLIRAVILDVEHEFGDLKEKSVLADFFNSSIPVAASADVTNNFGAPFMRESVSNSEASKKRSGSKNEDHIYCFSKVSEKLGIIETPVMGFMQSREVGITLEDMRPVYLTVLTSGWDEELDNSCITDEQRDKLGIVVEYFAYLASENWNIDEVDAQTYSTILSTTYNRLSQLAVDNFRMQGHDVDEMTTSELYGMVVEYLTGPELGLSMDEEIEEKVRQYAEATGDDYDELGAADKITRYYELYDIVMQVMLQSGVISEEAFDKLPETEQSEMVIKFMLENNLECFPE